MGENGKYKPNINGSLEQKRMEAQKRENLPDGVVFAKVNGLTEMHLLTRVHVHVEDVKSGIMFEGTLGDFIKQVLSDIMVKDKAIELQKKAIISIDDRLKHLEKVVKNYGLE